MQPGQSEEDYETYILDTKKAFDKKQCLLLTCKPAACITHPVAGVIESMRIEGIKPVLSELLLFEPAPELSELLLFEPAPRTVRAADFRTSTCSALFELLLSEPAPTLRCSAAAFRTCTCVVRAAAFRTCTCVVRAADFRSCTRERRAEPEVKEKEKLRKQQPEYKEQRKLQR